MSYESEVSASAPKIWWKLNDGTGSIATDYGSLNISGTWSAATSSTGRFLTGASDFTNPVYDPRVPMSAAAIFNSTSRIATANSVTECRHRSGSRARPV